MLDTRLQNQTQSFLDEFGAALETGDINAVAKRVDGSLASAKKPVPKSACKILINSRKKK